MLRIIRLHLPRLPNNTSDNPSTLTRTVSFEINDGDLNSNIVNRDIDFTAVNDAPVLSGIETAPASYTENDAPLAITGSTAVSDVDDTNIESVSYTHLTLPTKRIV